MPIRAVRQHLALVVTNEQESFDIQVKSLTVIPNIIEIPSAATCCTSTLVVELGVGVNNKRRRQGLCSIDMRCCRISY